MVGPTVKWLASVEGSNKESELGLLLFAVEFLDEAVFKPPLLFDVVILEFGLVFKAVFILYEDRGLMEERGLTLALVLLPRLDEVPGLRDSFIASFSSGGPMPSSIH